ncbi:MAG: DUF4430 domain-containing protein [Solobacterium sp.]|nr:DUF4430 domain-containing protein [Solobacterium sp.]
MKNIRILLSLLVALTITGCQKMITASINLNEGDGKESGMRAEMKEKSTIKDLFDAFSEGEEFTYEVDNEGYIVSINGKENGEFGYWEVLLNGELLDDVISKTVLNEGDVCDITYIPNESNPIVGGWEIAEVAREDLAENERQNFEKAMETVLGEEYEPVCVLATQLVSGTNYAYLARGTTVTAEPVSNFCIIKVYEDLNGNVELTSIADIELGDIKTRQDTDDEILGGWQVKDSGRPGTLGSAEAQASFDKATADLVGVGYNPIQLIAKQIVNGTNYIALVRGRAFGVDDTPELYIIEWYEDLDENSTVTDIKKFDLNYYVE